MKNKTIIRILAGLSFLIFFCPFFQMCSEDTLRKNQFTEVGMDAKEAAEAAIATEQSIESRKQESVKNFYEINSLFLDGVKEFKPEDYQDAGFYFAMCFAFSLVFSAIILSLSFLNKFKAIIIFAVGNLISSVLMTVLFYYDGGLEDFSQIKFGYYLFILNTIAIILFSRKQTNSTITT